MAYCKLSGANGRYFDTVIPMNRRVSASLSGLREADLASLDEGELLLFAVRCSNWASLARQSRLG